MQKFESDSVLSIGTPRVFESLKSVENVRRFLLDIDERFVRLLQHKTNRKIQFNCLLNLKMLFYPKKLFARYNMFNNHFFYNQKSYLEFVKSSKNLLVVIDPPYGGFVKLVANTIQNIIKGNSIDNA